jgi:hypothetical protein
LRTVVLVLLLLPLLAPAQTPPETPRRRVNSPVALYDDADPTAPGMLSVGSYFSYSSLRAGTDTTGPSFYVTVGLTPRIDFSADVGYVRSNFEQLPVSGMADSYFGAKILVMKEGKRRPAVAVKPMIEVLGGPSLTISAFAPDRVNFAPSVVVQKSFDNYRIYSMTGYITRGIAYESLGFELNRWSRITPLVAVSASRLTKEVTFVSDLGLNRTRSDVAGGLNVMLTPRWSAFGTIGRSFGRPDVNSTRYLVSGGINFNMSLRAER